MQLDLKITLIFLFLTLQINKAKATEPPFVRFKTDQWVVDKLAGMTLEEKIGQLMTIAVYPTHGHTSKAKILEQIATFKPGGILVMQGKPTETALFINDLQQQSKGPLLVSIDGEWGLSMRIDSVMKFPYAQAIGAVQDSTPIIQMGRDFAAQLKLMGIHMNFAPVADINTNPVNPVINFRSFGENKRNVAQKAWWVASGMQDAGIIPVAKHFPGHGDTSTDSHKTLPFLSHNKARMDSLETYTFRYLSDKGISGIMSAHLNVPSLDGSETPSSLSKSIVTNYLKNEIGFKGFVVTDAINMQGVRTSAGNTEREAIKAGNDIIEFVPDLGKAIQSVKSAVENGEISLNEINDKCRTILALKRWVNLNEYKPANIPQLTEKLNSPLFEVTNRKLIKGALTVLKNVNVLPVQNLDTLNIASLMIGGNEVSAFQKMLENYTRIDHFVLPKNASEQEWANLRMKLDNYNLVIVGIQGINIYPSKKYGTTEIQRQAVSEIVRENNAVFAFFGNSYALKHFDNIHHAKGLIVAYQNNELTQELAAQLTFGAFSSSGKLPVSIDDRFKVNAGLDVKKNDCFAYTIPEEVGINSKLLHKKIDSLAFIGLNAEAYPGCQVFIAKDGNVIFDECYGFHTYEKIRKMEPNDIYDWASITKVTGPLPAIMKLVDERKINLKAPLSEYWPTFKNSNKQYLRINEILAHQAGLSPWIPFWQMALTLKKELDPNVFKDQPTDKFNVRVSRNLYMNEDFRQTMYDTIRNSKLRPSKKYLYSGLVFYLFPQIISDLTGQEYEHYISKTFFEPLGAYTIVHNAYKQFPLDRIVPTETDDLFRHETLHGFVHDEGAGMMGGVSGNAGLFGTANDLGKVFQMYMQKGYFGGRRYISEETVNEFIRVQFPENKNRRGLGFDKPLINNKKNNIIDAYPAIDCSQNSFGHSGFTGTFAWADPDNGLLYIFMSNRVHPTRENQKLYNLNIRTGMHQKIYDCIKIGLH